MTFASHADMVARYGERELQLLAVRDNGGAYGEVIAAVLQDADAEIIGLLGGKVSIDPLDPPLNLIRLACEIARYRLYPSTPPDDVRRRYEDATTFLKRVADGKATLDGGATAPTEIAKPSLAAASVTPERIFKRGLR